MNKDEILKSLSEHRKKLDDFGVKSIALFGSVVRDESRPGSDVDILVEFQEKASFDQYMELKFFLQDLLGCSVDLVTHRALKPRVRPYVEREALYVT